MTKVHAERIYRLQARASSLIVGMQALVNELPESSAVRDWLVAANENLCQGEFELIKAMEAAENVIEFTQALEPFVEVQS